ncbi:unnamed protein product [Ectocarpus sp. 12 AP-2014]
MTFARKHKQREDDSNDDKEGHPYGVEPLGNIFLGRSSDCKPRGLGTLASFDDERILDLLCFLDAPALGRLACVSRALYVFAHVEELWKTLVVQEMARRPGQGVETRGGWKTTLQHIAAGRSASQRDGGGGSVADDERGGKSVPHVPLKVSGFFSDLLFQPHHCATTAIRPEWVRRNTVDRRAGLSPEEFRRLYEEPNKPVVLTDAAASWPALEKWTRSRLSAARGDLRLHAGGLEFALKDYLRYARESKDELPLYVFDKRFVDKCPDLGREYDVPGVFADDLFSVLGEERRPDHRWLIAGPARSGSSFHVDPNCTSAWNATVSGRKKWIMFPPGETPPGVHPSEDGLDLAAPVSITEWFLNFYEECHAPGRRVRPLECVVSAGEVVFVPMGWWHCVLNLEWSVAITQNFVSRVNLPHVVKFLLTQKHLISGLPPDQRDDLGERFVTAMSEQRPDLGVSEIAERATSSTTAAAGFGGCGGCVVENGGGSCRNGDTSKKRQKLWDKLKQGGGGEAVGVSDAGGASEDGGGGGGERAAAVNGGDGCAEGRSQTASSGGFSFGFSFS